MLKFNEWREKQKKDKNNAKSGYVSGNPRFNTAKSGKTRSTIKDADKKTNFDQK